MTRRMENFVRRMLYVATTMLLAGTVLMGVHMIMHPAEPHAIQWTDAVEPALKLQDVTPPSRDPMISKLAALRMSKTVNQSAPVQVKIPAPSLSMLLRVKGIMDFGDPKSTEVIIECLRGNSTKNYKVDDVVEGVDAKVLKIDKLVTFSYDGKEIQMGVNAEISIELPVAGQQVSPALSDNRAVPQSK